MLEVTGSLWTYPADVRVITTNGTVKKNGECVMGRGCAAEAKKKWPWVAAKLGLAVMNCANTPRILSDPSETDCATLVSMPVKHEWFQKADTSLIKVSATILARYADLHEWRVVVLPRPGCGNGGLRWEDVRPILEPILDNRFHVITW